eukprot:233400-Rhodomonas_salina.1
MPQTDQSPSKLMARHCLALASRNAMQNHTSGNPAPKQCNFRKKRERKRIVSAKHTLNVGFVNPPP